MQFRSDSPLPTEASPADLPRDPWSSRLRSKLPPTGWVRVFDISGQLPARSVGTGHGRGVIATAADGVWVANSWSRTVARLEPSAFELASLQELGKIPVAVAAGFDSVWVLCGNGWLWRIRSAGAAAEGVARLGRGARALAVAGPWVWVLRESGELIRLEPAVGAVTLETRVGRGTRNMVATEGALWVTRQRGRKLVRIDPESGEAEAEVRLPQRAIRLAAGASGVWVACGRRRSPRRGWLHAIDVGTASIERSAETNGEPRALAVGSGEVFVACAPRRHRKGAIERFDLADGSLQAWTDTDWPVFGLTVFGGYLLATMSLRVSGPADGGGVFDLGGGGGGGDGGGGGGHHG